MWYSSLFISQTTDGFAPGPCLGTTVAVLCCEKGKRSKVCQQMRYVHTVDVHTLHNKMEVTGVKVQRHSDTTSAVSK